MMIHRSIPRALRVLALVCSVLSTTALADVVCLDNGDRISGTAHVADGMVTIDTDYAGTLKIPMERVKAIETGSEAEDVGEATPASEAEETPKLWTGSVDAGSSWRSGDTDTLDANLGLALTRKADRTTLTLDLTGGYGEVDSEVNTRQVKGVAKYQYYFRDHLYGYGHTGAEHDPARRLDLRFETGVGLGYDVIETDRRSLALDLGLDYAHERWNKYSIRELEDAKAAFRTSSRSEIVAFVTATANKPPNTWTFNDLNNAMKLLTKTVKGVRQDTRSEDHVYLRLTARYKQKVFKTSTLEEELTLQPKLDDFGEFRLTSDLAFDTPLSDALSLRLSLLTKYDSDTGHGDDDTNNTFISALRYSF